MKDLMQLSNDVSLKNIQWKIIKWFWHAIQKEFREFVAVF